MPPVSCGSWHRERNLGLTRPALTLVILSRWFFWSDSLPTRQMFPRTQDGDLLNPIKWGRIRYEMRDIRVPCLIILKEKIYLSTVKSIVAAYFPIWRWHFLLLVLQIVTCSWVLLISGKLQRKCQSRGRSWRASAAHWERSEMNQGGDVVAASRNLCNQLWSDQPFSFLSFQTPLTSAAGSTSDQGLTRSDLRHGPSWLSFLRVTVG